jgi:hypothetical protein
MAREDTRWFVVGVVMLSLVLFFILPMAVLVAVDNEKRLGRAEARIDRKLKRLETLEENLSTQRSKHERTDPNLDKPTNASND